MTTYTRPLFGLIFLLLFILQPVFVSAMTPPPNLVAQQEARTLRESEPVIYMFGREDCGFCKAEKAWLEEENIPYTYLNIVEDGEAKRLWEAIAEKHSTSKVTPITVVGEQAFVGFNGAETTGKQILAAALNIDSTDIRTPQEHLDRAPAQSIEAGSGCTDAPA